MLAVLSRQTFKINAHRVISLGDKGLESETGRGRVKLDSIVHLSRHASREKKNEPCQVMPMCIRLQPAPPCIRLTALGL